jgi:DNA primase large subunit
MIYFSGQNSFNNKFPFTQEAKDYVRTMELTPDNLLEDESLVEKAFTSIKELLEHNYIVSNKIIELGKADTLKHYALIGYFLSLINESILWSRFAEIMRNEIEKNLTESDLNAISVRTFNWKIEYMKDKTIYKQIYNWKLKWYNFISVSCFIMDENWKLINNMIQNGWIYLTTPRVKRLIAEKVRKDITNKARLQPGKIPEIIEERINDFKDSVKEIRSNFQQSSYNITSEERVEAYPPCINNIINKAKSGMNLAHFERLVLVFFLLNIDFTVDEVINIFKLQPDFQEERARYYIEHAAGRVGGRTKYKPYNCIKLQSFEGICKKDSDPMGCVDH